MTRGYWQRIYKQIIALLHTFPLLAKRRFTRIKDSPLCIRFVYEQLGAPTRYRVQHQMEQARLAGLFVQDVSLEDTAHLYDLTDCELLYLYRLPLTSSTWPLCAMARWSGIPIVFDSDDLVWDPRERQYNYLDDHYPADVVADILKKTRRIRALMRRSDAFVFSTPYLAEHAAQVFHQPVYVNANALSAAMVAAAERAVALHRPSQEEVIIGYFCGTPHVHDEDMASIAPALAAVLGMCSQARLQIYGELALRGPLSETSFASRIERRPAVDWHALPQHIAQVDINIAPLIDNPQRRAKSAVKYLEAALVGVPTVASRLDPYEACITQEVTGLLARTQAEWASSLIRLVQSPGLRRQLGEAARIQALAEHTTRSRSTNFAAIIAQIMEQRCG